MQNFTGTEMNLNLTKNSIKSGDLYHIKSEAYALFNFKLNMFFVFFLH